VNRQIRRLGVFLMLCFLALFIQLNYVQVLKAKELNRHAGNSRPVDQAFSRGRGTVVSADGAVLARSDPSHDRYKFQRRFPESSLFGHVTGYFNFDFGATGIESAYNSELSGSTAKQKLRSFSDLFVEHQRTGNVSLTIRKDVQQVAREALGTRKGSVVALDPKTGDILAFWTACRNIRGRPTTLLRRSSACSRPAPTSHCWPACTARRSSPARRSRWSRVRSASSRVR
jgi:peptidoglycan glycosyltransferase